MADPGGGVQGVRTPPPFGPRCRLFNIGPKVGPPLGPPPFLLVDLRWTPEADPGCVCDRGDHPAPLGMWMTSHGQCPRGVCVLVNVQEWGCFSIFLRADDVTRTMSKGGACEKSCIRAWTPPPLSKILDPPLEPTNFAVALTLTTHCDILLPVTGLDIIMTRPKVFGLFQFQSPMARLPEAKPGDPTPTPPQRPHE